MTHRLEKNMRILDELVGYCVRRGAKNVDMNIKFDDDYSEVSVMAYIKDVPQTDLDDLNEVLNISRQHEIEEYYWHVSGDDSLGDEMELIGIMVDEAKVTYEKDILTITAKRCIM